MICRAGPGTPGLVQDASEFAEPLRAVSIIERVKGELLFSGAVGVALRSLFVTSPETLSVGNSLAFSASSNSSESLMLSMMKPTMRSGSVTKKSNLLKIGVMKLRWNQQVPMTQAIAASDRDCSSSFRQPRPGGVAHWNRRMPHLTASTTFLMSPIHSRTLLMKASAFSNGSAACLIRSTKSSFNAASASATSKRKLAASVSTLSMNSSPKMARNSASAPAFNAAFSLSATRWMITLKKALATLNATRMIAPMILSPELRFVGGLALPQRLELLPGLLVESSEFEDEWPEEAPQPAEITAPAVP